MVPVRRLRPEPTGDHDDLDARADQLRRDDGTNRAGVLAEKAPGLLFLRYVLNLC